MCHIIIMFLIRCLIITILTLDQYFQNLLKIVFHYFYYRIFYILCSFNNIKNAKSQFLGGTSNTIWVTCNGPQALDEFAFDAKAGRNGSQDIFECTLPSIHLGVNVLFSLFPLHSFLYLPPSFFFSISDINNVINILKGSKETSIMKAKLSWAILFIFVKIFYTNMFI